MKTTIEKLWFGQLAPIEAFGKNNPEIKRMERLMSDRLVRIQEALNGKHNDLYNEFYDVLYDYISEATKQSFCEGYFLATKITAEAFLGEEQLEQNDKFKKG